MEYIPTDTIDGLSTAFFEMLISYVVRCAEERQAQCKIPPRVKGFWALGFVLNVDSETVRVIADSGILDQAMSQADGDVVFDTRKVMQLLLAEHERNKTR